MSATMARGLLNKKYKIYNISKAEYQSVYFIFFILVSLFVFSIFIVFNHNISTLIYNLDDRKSIVLLVLIMLFCWLVQ